MAGAAAAEACPCGRLDARGRPRPFEGCCAPWLAGAPAPDPESLMRSRYTAFVLERSDYLLATWHPTTRPATLDLEPAARWLGLEVRACGASGASDAWVEFVARYRVHGRAVRLHEHSRFRRDSDGRWYYIDGDDLENGGTILR